LAQAAAGPFEVGRLAELLGVLPEALVRLEIGYEPETEKEPEHWLIPERDAAGSVVGLIRRYANGAKRQYPGSHRGLTFDPGAASNGLLLAPEGPSDVAAAFTLGLDAIGRPSNLGGADLLAQRLAPAVRAGLEVIVLAENDRKP